MFSAKLPGAPKSEDPGARQIKKNLFTMTKSRRDYRAQAFDNSRRQGKFHFPSDIVACKRRLVEPVGIEPTTSSLQS